MNNPWTIVRQYFLDQWAAAPTLPKPSLEQRINAQVRAMEFSANAMDARVSKLEAKSMNMNAYYMKVLGTALKGHADSQIDKLRLQLDAKTNMLDQKINNFHHQLDASNTKRIDNLHDVHDAITRNELEIAKLSARLTSFIGNLRKLGESNQ